MSDPSPFLVWSFAALGVLVAAAFPLGLRRAGGRWKVAGAGAALWLALTASAASSGMLGFTGTPPTMVLLLVAVLTLALGLGLSGVGKQLASGLPLAALVGVQSFRLPLELLMHRAFEEGVMPGQMSYSGRNFDIVTGITAIGVAGLLAAGRMPTWGVRAWNWMGMALLVNVVVIANLSTPTPFRVFMNEPANVWIARAPFVWLPAVMVLTALLGHIVIFRRLRAAPGDTWNQW
ncbi:MAG TPA: hypothetical protein VE913_20260 [Longimicrobium sp.]|nr:hypothetical protein [Longimicrobium sp.]